MAWRGSTVPVRPGGTLRSTALVVVVACLLHACGGGDEDDAAAATYRSPIYGYAISHPPTWTAVDAQRPLGVDELPTTGTGATDILGQDASSKVGTMTLPGVIIAAQPVGADVDLETWTASMIGTVSAMKGCDAPSGRDAVEIDGEPGIVLTSPNCPAERGYLHLWAGVVHDGRGYHVVWFDEPGREDEDRVDFERMLSSFVFGEASP
jgi:hypothetical protein